MELVFDIERTPPSIDTGSSDLEVWNDNDGRPCVYGQRVAGSNWMHVPGIGSFCFTNSPGVVTATPERDVCDEDVIDTYYRSILPTALQVWGREVIHSSAVVIDSGVVAFCARSGTGKSTLAYALNQRGHPIYADDAVVFRVAQGRVALEEIPFAIRLRKEAAEHFRTLSKDVVKVTGRNSSIERKAPPLRALCVIERFQPASDTLGATGTDPIVTIERMDPSTAFTAVLPHAYCFSLRDRERKGLMMQQYMALARSVPVLHLKFRPGLEYLPAVLDELEAALALRKSDEAA